MFQKDELFTGMPNVFGIADDISIAGFNEQGRDHDAILDEVHRICMQQTWNLTKIHFGPDIFSFFICKAFPQFMWKLEIRELDID